MFKSTVRNLNCFMFQILPSVPVKTTPDGYHASVLLLSKKVQEADAGYYVCLALNNAGYNYRQVYLNVTTASGSHSKKSKRGLRLYIIHCASLFDYDSL